MKYTNNGKLPSCDDSSINEASFEKFKRIINSSIRGGTTYSKGIV
jgi:hypothetical protein